MGGEADILRRLAALEARLAATEATEKSGRLVSWTPTYYGFTTGGVTTYTTQTGTYIRIGNLVVATGYLAWTAATGTGNALIGLPFTAANVANIRYGAMIFPDSVTYGGTGVGGYILPNTNYIILGSPQNNAGSLAVNVEAAGFLTFTVAYFI